MATWTVVGFAALDLEFDSWRRFFFFLLLFVVYNFLGIFVFLRCCHPSGLLGNSSERYFCIFFIAACFLHVARCSHLACVFLAHLALAFFLHLLFDCGASGSLQSCIFQAGAPSHLCARGELGAQRWASQSERGVRKSPAVSGILPKPPSGEPMWW